MDLQLVANSQKVEKRKKALTPLDAQFLRESATRGVLSC